MERHQLVHVAVLHGGTQPVREHVLPCRDHRREGASFPQPPGGWAAVDFGTDGGAHNFLRMLEQGGTVNYVGSIATFFYNRQATGTFKCCTTVYGAPTRNFAFDTDFLDPTKLPPLTPVFRDLDTLGFSQVIQAGQ